MKASEAIALADELCPNPFSSAYKLRLLNQIEYRVRIDILKEDPAEVEPIVQADLATTDLTLHDRYTEIYIGWLKAKYYWAMGEYDIYQNEKAMFKAEWDRWVRDICDERHAGSGAPEYVYPAFEEATEDDADEDPDDSEEDPEDEGT